MKAQVFIHRYYDAIKLTLLMILVALSVLIVLNQLESNDQASKGRQEAIGQVLQGITTETNKQTDVINRQLRALCIVIIETSGQEGLDKLDPETRSRCENLSTPEEELQSAAPSSPESSPPSNISSVRSSSNNTPSSNNKQSEAPQSPTPPEEQNPPVATIPAPSSIIPLVDGPIVGCQVLPLIGKTCL